MQFRPIESTRTRHLDLRIGLISVLGIWAFYFVVATIRIAIADYPTQTEMLIYRVFVTAFAIGITFILYLLLSRVADYPLRLRIPIAFAGALPVAVAIAAFNMFVFEIADPMSILESPEWAEQRALVEQMHSQDPWLLWKALGEAAASRYFVVIAWTMLYMALGYAQIVRRAERRAAIFAQEAQTAQLRALRYQVNPHFLFNTLNVLSTLVMRDRRDEAEKMILNLSTFYRTSLTSEPADDVPLEEEIRLQRLYLDIEAVRFPERLKVDIAVPAELNDCCVPALILQPLVENAIKYGVSRVRRPVTVSISAREEDGVLIITVADDGDPMPEDSGLGGTGVGLNNVHDRLAARYGEAGRASWGPGENGGFAVTLEMPINRESC